MGEGVYEERGVWVELCGSGGVDESMGEDVLESNEAT